jgi:GntR family histidine utilization transcriptional repressor
MTENTTFRDVKAEILRRITQGPWGPGTLLPGEVELAEEFGCSRTTMNRALREVNDLGLLDRRRKAGTRVRMTPLRQARFEMPVVRDEVEKTGATYRYQLLSREVRRAPDEISVKMKLAKGSKVVHVTCLHFANGAPFQLEDRWINVAALPDVLAQDFAQIGPNEWLISTVPYSEVEISFSAIPADPAAVQHLGCAPAAPVFCVKRATWWQSAAITRVTLMYHQGYEMTARY